MDNPLSILIQAALDEKLSEKNINKNLKKLKIDSVKVDLGIDAKTLGALTKQVKELQATLGKLGRRKIKIFDENEFNDKPRQLFDSMHKAVKEFERLGKVTIPSKKFDPLTKDLTDFTLKIEKASGEVEKLKFSLAHIADNKGNLSQKFAVTGLNGIDNTTKIYEDQLKKLDLVKSAFNAKINELQKMGLNDKQLSPLSNAVRLINPDTTKQEIQQLNQIYKELKKSQDEVIKRNNDVQNQINKINNSKLKLETGRAGINDQEFINKTQRAYDLLIQKINQVVQANRTMSSEEEKQYQRKLMLIQSAIDKQKQLERAKASSGVSQHDVDMFQKNMQIRAQNLQTQYGRNVDKQGLQSLINEINKISPATANAKQKMQELSMQMRQLQADASKVAHTFKAELLHHMETLMSYAIGGGIFYGLTQGATGLVKNIALVEREMAGVIQVLPQLHGDQLALNNATSEFIGIAEKYGQSINEVLSGAKLWGRMYKDLNVVLELVNSTTLLSVVDNLSLEQANRSLILGLYDRNIISKPL
ncbi:hypothetical protein D1872_155320 [compost metagenome]